MELDRPREWSANDLIQWNDLVTNTLISDTFVVEQLLDPQPSRRFFRLRP